MKVIEELIAAASRGDERTIEALLPQCDARERPDGEDSALMVAAKNGHAQCVRLLLPHSDLNATDEWHHTALIWSAINNHRACVNLLLEAEPLTPETEATVLASARFGQHSDLPGYLESYFLAKREKDELDSLPATFVPSVPARRRTL